MKLQLQESCNGKINFSDLKQDILSKLPLIEKQTKCFRGGEWWCDHFLNKLKTEMEHLC